MSFREEVVKTPEGTTTPANVNNNKRPRNEEEQDNDDEDGKTRKVNEEGKNIMSFTLNCGFEAAWAAARKRKREAIAASSFQKQSAADMKKPYYRIFVHLGGEVDDMQPPETFHSTALEAAKAVMDFLFGTYGYGEGTYEIDLPAWISDELCVDDSPISCCVTLIDHEELAKLIQKDVSSTRGEFKLTGSHSDKFPSFLQITLVD